MGNRLRGMVSSQTPAAPVEGLVVSQQINTGVLFDPTADGWDIVERAFDCNVWRNRNTGEQVQEYRLVANDEFEFLDYEKSFKLRYRNITLVSSLFFKDETQSEFCSKYYKGNLYLERIPLRLSDIDEIPYPDVLHIYSQCFKGFAELYEAIGFFDIAEEMICINASGVVKVWLNKNLDKYLPPVSYHNGNEREMVLKVLRIVSQNTNQNTLPDRISDWVVRADPYTFRDAFSSLEGFASKYSTNIPTALECVINFMKLKYIEEEEVYEGAPMNLNFDLPPHELDIEGLNQMIGDNLTPLFDQPPQYQQYPLPSVKRPIPPPTTTIVTQDIYHQPQPQGHIQYQHQHHYQPQPHVQVQRKRRRILQHKDHPILYSNIIRDPTSGRIPMSSIVTGPPQVENRITFGHQPVQTLNSDVYSSQNPFKSVLEKLQIPNHHQHKPPVAVTQTVYIPERDVVKSTSYDNPYVSSSQRQPPSYSYESGIITSGGGVVTNSLAVHSTSKYPTYGNYGVYDDPEEGKTSPQLLNFIRKFKNISNNKPYEFETKIPHKEASSPYKYESSSYKYESISPYKYEPAAPIISQTSRGAVYQDVGDTSHLVNSYAYKFADSISVQNRVEIIEDTIVEKKSIYREQVSRPKDRYELMNIDQEIQKDLKKLRGSKASKASKTSQYR